MAVSMPPPRVQRERDRIEQLERDSDSKLQQLLISSNNTNKMPPSRGPAAPRQRSRSGSISSSSLSGSPDVPLNFLQVAIPTSAATAPATQHPSSTASYPNYYDYSENAFPPPSSSSAHPKMASMAMQVPIQPQHPPQQRLVDTKGPNNPSQRGPSSRDRPPSYSNTSATNVNSPDDIILPPNKVDLDAARYRRAQQQESRESRREREHRDRDQRSKPHDRKPSNSNPNGNRPSSSGMGPTSHHQNGGRPLSPESPLLTPTGPNIQRLPTPSIPNSVLQPLDAKVVEYGSLMAEAQSEMARLNEDMRVLQDRQREAEQRFLDAKAKHDDYRRQYSDVERALRGELGPRMNGAGGRAVHLHDDDDDVPPVPSMPSLGQYATNGPNSRGGSGNLLNGNHQNGPGPNGPGPMPPRRTVSIQSDMVSQESVRSHQKPRGRFSRLFGV